MILNKHIRKEIKAHALKLEPEECCGLVVEDERSETYNIFKCRNSSVDNRKHFKILPSDYLKASRAGDIKAVYRPYDATRRDHILIAFNDLLTSGTDMTITK